jgi:hypothetical protein
MSGDLLAERNILARENKRLRAELAQAVEALRPFAAYYHPSQERMDGRMLSRRQMPDEPCYLTGDEIGLTAVDFAECRRVLTSIERGGTIAMDRGAERVIREAVQPAPSDEEIPW